jgi:hypothetical protein
MDAAVIGPVQHTGSIGYCIFNLDIRDEGFQFVPTIARLDAIEESFAVRSAFTCCSEGAAIQRRRPSWLQLVVVSSRRGMR